MISQNCNHCNPVTTTDIMLLASELYTFNYLCFNVKAFVVISVNRVSFIHYDG